MPGVKRAPVRRLCGAYYDLHVTVPGKGQVGVNVTPQNTVEVSIGKEGAAKQVDATCEQNG